MTRSTILTLAGVLWAASLLADPPTPNADGNCGGACQVTCINGCDTGHSYSWQQARCAADTLSDAVGPYCRDGYNCDSGACGRAGERICNVAGTGCSVCASGYQYASARAYCIAAYASPGNHPNWMREMSTYISSKPLNRLTIPGTHDSGSYPMVGLAKTQNHSIADQLKGGIRFFDLRAGVLITPIPPSPLLVRFPHLLHHGIDYTGPKIQTVLDEVKAFLTTNVGEIVFLNFSEFTSYNDAEVTELSGMIDKTLGTLLVNHQTIRPASTVSAVWGGAPKSAAIVIFDGKTSRYWTGSEKQGSWANTTQRAYFKTTMDAKLNSWSNATNMTIIQSEATPYADRTDNFHKIWFPSWLAEDTNPVVLRWIKEEWSGRNINVIDVDFYDQSCLVPLAKWFNQGKPAGAIPGCYSWPTANKDVWDAKVWAY